MLRKSNPLSIMLAMMAMLLVAGGAMAQRAKGKVIAEDSARGGKAAVVAVKRGDVVEFAADKKRMMEYVQKALEQTSRGDVVKDIYIQTLEKQSFFAIQIEKQGTVFLGLTPSGGGIQGIFTLSPDIVKCAGGCGAGRGCALGWRQVGTNPQLQLTCDCEIKDGGSTEPSGGGSCHMEAVIKYAQLAININDLLVAEKFELTDAPGPRKAVEANPAVKSVRRNR